MHSRYDPTMAWRGWVGMFCILMSAFAGAAPARADDPNTAEVMLWRLERELGGMFKEGAKVEDADLAQLMRQLNDLNAYGWDELAGAMEKNLPPSEALSRLRKLLVASTALQAVMALSLEPSQSAPVTGKRKKDGPLLPLNLLLEELTRRGLASAEALHGEAP